MRGQEDRFWTPGATWTALHCAALVGATLWMAWIVAAPLARAAESTLAPWLYLAFDTVCHQRPDRSFQLAGHPLAVCHRCFGLYLGFFVGFVIQGFWSGPRHLLLRQPIWIVVCALPMLFDALLLPLWIENVPWSRFVTGLFASAPVSALVWEALRQLSESRRVSTAGGPTTSTD
ncbi:MAG: DUF2085 domain-containing protein [Acidobacteriota bacterium]